MITRHKFETWGVTKSIFEKLSKEGESGQQDFTIKITQHYYYFFAKYGYEPKIIEDRMHDAWHGFCHDKIHAYDSLHPKSTSPDHFKLSGILAYWLRRFSPWVN